MDNRDPYIFKTADFGKTWTKISDGLPMHSLAYVRTITEDPNQKGLLFAGTGNGVYYSLDDGRHWAALNAGLPHAPVSWAVVQKQFCDLVISTYGRGLYILDDITPLEQMAQKTSDAPVRLFEPRQTFRIFPNGGAWINYSLKTAPKNPPKIEILDSNGAIIRKIDGLARAGMNRVEWDFRHEPPRLVALRTTPPENQHIWEERRFRGSDSRPILHWGIKEAEVGPMALPGKYTVRLTVDGQSFTQPLTILKNPNANASDEDLTASFKTQLQIRDDISKTADAVNKMEWMPTRCHRAHAGGPKRARSGQRSEKRPGQRTKERSRQKSRRGPRETERERGVVEVRRSDGSEDARGGIQIHLASRSLER